MQAILPYNTLNKQNFLLCAKRLGFHQTAAVCIYNNYKSTNIFKTNWKFPFHVVQIPLYYARK